MTTNERSTSSSTPDALPSEDFATTESRLRIAIVRALNLGEPLNPNEVSDEDFDRLGAHIQDGEHNQWIDRAMEPLGRFIVSCSATQEALSTVLATVLNPIEPRRIVQVLRRMPASVMVDQLRAALPKTGYYRTFLNKAEELLKLRNAAAHGQITTYRFQPHGVEYGVWLVSERGEYEDISGERLRDLDRMARMVAASASATTVIESPYLKLPPTATFGDIILIASNLVPEHLPERSRWASDMAMEWYPQAKSRLKSREAAAEKSEPTTE